MTLTNCPIDPDDLPVEDMNRVREELAKGFRDFLFQVTPREVFALSVFAGGVKESWLPGLQHLKDDSDSQESPQAEAK